MAKKGKDKKSLIKKIKTSPASKELKEKGPKKVAKTIGGLAKGVVSEGMDKLGNALGLLEEPSTRQEHFDQGGSEHITPAAVAAKREQIRIMDKDLPHAHDIVEQYWQKKEDPTPFRQGNVSSILNAYQIRERKAPPEGY